MTERRRQDDHQIEQLVLVKLDALTENFNEFKLTVSTTLAELSTKVESQPKIDQQTFINLKENNFTCQTNSNKRFTAIEARQDKQEAESNKTKWFWIAQMVTFIMYVIYDAISK